MEKTSKKPTGIELMIEKYKEIFRIPENLRHYSETDFRTAERKFLKWVGQLMLKSMSGKPSQLMITINGFSL